MNTNKPIKNTETAFKCAIYWKQDKNGVRFSPQQIKDKQNRAYLPSHDYVGTKGGKTLTNHQISLQKLDNFIASCAGKYYTALVFYNSGMGEVVIRKYIDGTLISARDVVFDAVGANKEHIQVRGYNGDAISLGTLNENHVNNLQGEELKERSEEIRKQFTADNFRNLKKTVAENSLNMVHNSVDKLREQYGTKNMNYAQNNKKDSN